MLNKTLLNSLNRLRALKFPLASLIICTTLLADFCTSWNHKYKVIPWALQLYFRSWRCLNDCAECLHIWAKVLIVFYASNCKWWLKDYKWSFRNWKLLGVSFRNPNCCSIQVDFSDCSSFLCRKPGFLLLCPWLLCVDLGFILCPFLQRTRGCDDVSIDSGQSVFLLIMCDPEN